MSLEKKIHCHFWSTSKPAREARYTYSAFGDSLQYTILTIVLLSNIWRSIGTPSIVSKHYLSAIAGAVCGPRTFILPRTRQVGIFSEYRVRR